MAKRNTTVPYLRQKVGHAFSGEKAIQGAIPKVPVSSICVSVRLTYSARSAEIAESRAQDVWVLDKDPASHWYGP